MNTRLKLILEKEFSFKINKNQLKELERLISEIMHREDISGRKILKDLRASAGIEKYPPSRKFLFLKNALIKRRFPLTFEKEQINPKKLFLSKVSQTLDNIWPSAAPFKPLQIFVEDAVSDSYLVDNFKNKFPDIKISQINRYSDYLKNNKFHISQLKKPVVFLIKEKWDFIKPCPCTKHHLRCGYWIFNLGFGCPFDCSYCFLQQYTNFPGILLPANIDDFFEKFDKFSKNLKKPIRIGTGEFCDSLALDHITEYSKKLIPYFKNKNVIFELKTKSDNIDNLLKVQPGKNIVISWSLNPPSLIGSEEKTTASLNQRLTAAKKIQAHGYKIAFHFDPIIAVNDWNEIYKYLIDELYSIIDPPFSWISLGTLRCNRKLKTITEARFPESHIFYGELFLDDDKKLRYPKFIRNDIYERILKWIRNHDQKTPVYLCMEGNDSWKILGDFASAKDIENHLLPKSI